jgi:hypothetical protein
MRTNVDPKEWGGSAWKFLQSCAEAYDDSCADSYITLMSLLPTVLPCEKCRLHSADYIEANPVDTGDLKGWLDRFRNAVAARTKGVVYNPSTLELHLEPKKGCKRTVFLVLTSILAVSILILLIFTLFKLRKAD